MEKQNRVGQKAGHLVLKDELGGQVHLADLRGAWLWMIFHRHLG
jgi:peroxiredoxin